MKLSTDSSTSAPAFPAISSAVVTLADVAYARFTRLNRQHHAVVSTGDYHLLPSMDALNAVESAFLAAPAESADVIVKKLELAEFYLDETDCGSPGDLEAVRLVIALVRKGELEDALRYARAIVGGYADDYGYAPIHAAIANMEALR